MIKTHGLNHINLEVSDPDVSLKFYQQLFGVKEYFRDEISIQALGPGKKDVIAFVKSDRAGDAGCGFARPTSPRGGRRYDGGDDRRGQLNPEQYRSRPPVRGLFERMKPDLRDFVSAVQPEKR